MQRLALILTISNQEPTFKNLSKSDQDEIKKNRYFSVFIIEIKAEIGQQINAGDILLSVETDKATREYESPEDGHLAEIFIDEGFVNFDKYNLS